MERFAKCHLQTLNALLGTDFGKSPSDSTFRLLLAQLDLPGFETLLRDWMVAQPGVAAELDTLVSYGKVLRGSIAESDCGAARFIAQVTLYSQTLGIAIAQTTHATDASGEIQALRLLLEAVELEGVLVPPVSGNVPVQLCTPSRPKHPRPNPKPIATLNLGRPGHNR